MIGSDASAAVATSPDASAAVTAGVGTGPATTSPTSPPVTLLIADDDEVTRSGLRTLLAARPGIAVVGEAADGVEAVEQVRRLRPDVVLMDVRMPRRNGIEATRQLLAESAEPPKVVVITTFENDGYVTAALSAGASGFVLKRLPVQQIAEAVRVVAAGEAILFPAALRRMVAARPLGSAEALPKAALTGREEEVLRLMATGLSNPEIAESLTVSLETVKTHVGNVLTKLGAQNRTHAVVIAYESGLVVPGFAG
ncbi:response regulator transcription factor [Streptomyces sp. NBC_01221]|uniref:response regulator transcription factor n=1 Tax=unclassified Streptomyces TaxID=2593676 RepID=UPI0022587FF6|nr:MULTISPECIES: response regulator transcription factor [unclassified Streptomyces]WSP57617.1 response regulator transcription factor [Streptomyces sp. NBC_01241]WSU21652.1 response regulator transcription factor [Streptomyces sp. NBC_01108]MCX4789484.1 response regulator transcription factor [Streptomyces sp. NBC_01221]MCX4794795.1 response regulator transcription factor [Streptomyces sp. NBC_01242]WSJ36112.1 response regulator transcription factor [Streptomyces sp. NBC_01321]